MRKTKWAVLAAVLAGSMLLAGPASAYSLGTVNAEFINLSPNGAPQGVGGGVFNFQRMPGGTFTGTLLSGAAGMFVGICLDINQKVNTGTATYDLRTLNDAPLPSGGMGDVKAADIAMFVGSALGGILTNASLLDNKHAAGLQLAIWEIVNENSGTYSIYDGNFVGQVPDWMNPSAGALAAAEEYLSAFKSYQGLAAEGLFAMTNLSSQDFLVQTVVPLPPAAWLLGAGMLGLFGLARRRKTGTSA
jgi:hypothetical protein